MKPDTQPPRPKGLAWDFDGVIGATEATYDRLFQDYGLEKTGKALDEATFRKMRSEQFGRKTLESAAIAHRFYGISEPPEVHVEWRKTYDLNELFFDTQAMPGAEQLIKKLHRRIPLVLATSSTSEQLIAKTRKMPWIWDIFGDNIITGEKVQHGKPHPEMYLEAANKLKLDPKDMWAFEDAPSGAKSAKAAGMFVFAIPDPRLPNKKIQLADADVILPSLKDFKPEQWGLKLP